jgi:hypothetical protein
VLNDRQEQAAKGEENPVSSQMNRLVAAFGGIRVESGGQS